jgi:hypothetical protein
MARKTIEVGKVLRIANTFLAAKNTRPDEREGVAALLETMLFETGNYQGFRYLEGADYPGETDGLGSRRFYFASKAVLQDEADPIRDANVIRV